MKTITEVRPECITSSVWLNGDSDSLGDDFPRYDAVKTQIDRVTGNAAVISLQDNELPILHCRISEFRAASNYFETIAIMLENEETSIHYGKALAMSILSYLTGIELSDHTKKHHSFSIEDLFQIDNTAQYFLEIPRTTADAGIAAGILKRNNTRLYPSLDLKSESNFSALSAAFIMHSDRTKYGIQLPEGFDNIDLEAAKLALQATSTPSASTVIYFGDTTSIYHKQRIQAASSYPLFADRLEIDPELRQLVDHQKPLSSTLSKRLGLSRGHLKRLQKIQSPIESFQPFDTNLVEIGLNQIEGERNRIHRISGELRQVEILELLCQYPSNWSPNCQTAWTSFVDVVATCGKSIHSSFDMPIQDVLAASKGNWIEYKLSLARTYEMHPDEFDRRQLALVTSDAIDMLDDFSRSVILPLLLSTIIDYGNPIPAPTADCFDRGQKIAFQLITHNAKNIMSNLLKSARDWTSRIPALMDAEAIDSPQVKTHDKEFADSKSWPPLINNFTASNGLVIQNLHTEEHLKNESRRLKHCVGRLYLRKAKLGNCHIFSVRNADLSKSYSTLELSPVETVSERQQHAEFRILQHKAKSNRRPDEQAKLASKEWLAAIRSGQLPIDIQTASCWRQRQRENQIQESSHGILSKDAIMVQWSAALGRNWFNPKVRAAIWHEWTTHILHGKLSRAENPNYLLVNKNLQKLLSALCNKTSEVLYPEIINT